MRLLAIDPGLKVTGYACLESDGPSRPVTIVEAGCFRFSPKASVGERLVELDTDLSDLLERTRPSAAAVEALFSHYAHPRPAIVMAHARGVIMLRLKAAGIDPVELAPKTVKKALTGSGSAGKAQIQRAVQVELKLDQVPEPHDIADAMAIGLAGLWRSAGGTGLRPV
ncbi:MAG: crossover junction endodeoxyribonuclease RuvC [Phycisphaerales bacterium JB050]